MKKPSKTAVASGFAESAAAYASGATKRKHKAANNFPSVTASEFAKNFGEYREQALYRPVAVTSHGRTVGYFISPQHFEQYVRLLPARRAYKVEELPESTIRAMVNSKMDKKYDYLNKLLDD
jgi:hypothetical protein